MRAISKLITSIPVLAVVTFQSEQEGNAMEILDKHPDWLTFLQPNSKQEKQKYKNY